MKAIIAPDKFKGTLTAPAAAEAIRRGWAGVRPQDELELLPMSDGGDGFGEILGALLGASTQTTRTVDAAHRPIEAQWWWSPESQTAIIEAARVNGLAQLRPGNFHPFELDTFGLGALLRAAVGQGARRCLLGIGGSATNDGGLGLARALGWNFFNTHGQRIERWTELHTLSEVHPPERIEWFEEMIVAVDVQNLLLGAGGCTRVYGPQKGLRAEDFEFAERCLGRLAEVFAREFHRDPAARPGAGAAGGLGFGLVAFCGGRIEPGFSLFARFSQLAERLQGAQLVITGEGAIDAQTLMGKGVGELALLCKNSGVPCLGLGGVVSDPESARELFHQTCALTPDLTDSAQALASAAHWLEQAAAKAARDWCGGGRPSLP